MIKNFIKKETTIFIFLLILIPLAIIYPQKIKEYPSFIDFRTIWTLAGLILITTSLKESGYFYLILNSIISKLKTERSLAFSFILLSMGISTFMTNDIALFIVVPITLALRDIIKNDTSLLIIFEALSVNVGSSLTPVGNPQNLFIWHQWGIGFFGFVFKMFPLVAVMSVILFLFALLTFKPKKIDIHENFQFRAHDKFQFYFSLLLLLLYILTISFGFEFYLFVAIFLIFVFYKRKVILKTDWTVILFFIIIFIDFHILASVPLINSIVKAIDFQHSIGVFLTSVVFSQFMSNVPAAIFLSKFSKNWLALSYGVNLAGNGFFIASLANVIALRMAKDKKIWFDFHKYSTTFLLASLFAAIFIFFLL
jgi:Na+/H+ antiporter NhaD/arsenite permease-like protein